MTEFLAFIIKSCWKMTMPSTKESLHTSLGGKMQNIVNRIEIFHPFVSIQL